jgi:EmrB/QacA subfamily drug resistance transporter
MRAPLLIPLIVACALFMENLDQTIIATALPSIARDIGASPIALKLGVTSYLLSQAVFTPASGWMADRFGARLVFRLAIGLFTVSSVFCGLAGSIGAIVVARVFQGFGGAMMVPVGRLLVLRSVSRAEMVSALAWLTIPAVVGPILGPPVGGFITTYFSWRYIFWINVPIGIIGILLATVFVPDIRAEGAMRFDPIGFLLTGLGLATLVTGATSLGLGVIPLWAGLAMVAIGSLCLLLYRSHAARVANPIMDLSLFRLPTFRASMTGGSLFRIGMGASPFLLPLLFQFGFGLNPLHSGLLTFVSAVGAFAMKFAAPRLLRRIGFRRILIGNAVVSALLVMVPAVFTAATPEVIVILVLLVSGFFRSLQFTSVTALAYAEVEPAGMSAATSISSVGQPVATSIGVSIGAMALEASMTLRGGTIPVTADFAPAFVLVGVVAATSFFFFNALPRNAGSELTGHRRPPPAGLEKQSAAAD